MGLKSIWTKVYQTLASVRTGIFLIIVVGIFSADRYGHSAASHLGAGGYAARIFAGDPAVARPSRAHRYLPCLVVPALLCLFCVCLIFVSLDRWPNAWKVYAKPVRFAAPHFRLSLPQTVKIAVTDEAGALSVAERVLSRFGFKPERVTENGATGLFAEKQRFSVLAVYLVHLSLICIFAGYIVDGIVGYRGNINVPEGQALGQITLRDNRGGES